MCVQRSILFSSARDQSTRRFLEHVQDITPRSQSARDACLIKSCNWSAAGTLIMHQFHTTFLASGLHVSWMRKPARLPRPRLEASSSYALSKFIRFTEDEV